MGLFNIDQGTTVESALKSAKANIELAISHKDCEHLISFAFGDFLNALDRRQNFSDSFTRYNRLLVLLSRKVPDHLLERRNALLNNINNAISVNDIEDLFSEVHKYEDRVRNCIKSDFKLKKKIKDSEIVLLVNKANRYLEQNDINKATLIADIIRDDLNNIALLALDWFVEDCLGMPPAMRLVNLNKLKDYGILLLKDTDVFTITPLAKLIYRPTKKLIKETENNAVL